MRIGGIQPLTLLDFPGKIACIIFTSGCNMRCGYCHNDHLVVPKCIQKQKMIPEESFFQFLKTRKNLLEGVVISGGEPSIHPDLITFMEKIKEEGFLIKLDTNGSNPEIIQEALDKNLLDFIAMDVKTNPSDYKNLTKTTTKWNQFEKSKQIILKSTIPYELRTTFIKGYHTKDHIDGIYEFCKNAQTYIIQNFRPQKTIDPRMRKFSGFSRPELEEIQKKFQHCIPKVRIEAE